PPLRGAPNQAFDPSLGAEAHVISGVAQQLAEGDEQERLHLAFPYHFHELAAHGATSPPGAARVRRRRDLVSRARTGPRIGRQRFLPLVAVERRSILMLSAFGGPKASAS